ncbi:MAG TPA: DUF2807 domain-containing protein [Chitinophagaceae bacterium]|nr:DUF2807 domain-containing protein [Chitinophagaceae bacterium]
MKQLFQSSKLGQRVLLPIIVFTISLVTEAQPYFQNTVTRSREIQLTQPFDEVEVVGDVTIILTNNFEGRVLFLGDINDLQLAKATIKNKKLIIDAGRKKSGSKLTIYLPASGLDLLTTSGKTEILSSGTIKTSHLELLLNGSSLVSVHYDGKLTVTPGTGYELAYTKN